MISRIRHLILGLTLGTAFLFLMALLIALPVKAGDVIVFNTNDSGGGSLREAIATAGDGDTILFDSSLKGQTISLTSGELLITKNLTISGPGANLLAISGNNASRVFYITSMVTISGVMIKEGSFFGNGGGIYNDGGTVNLTNSTVFGNTAFGDGVSILSDGGGIYNDGGNINLTNSTVSNNKASCFCVAGDGGGISSFGGTVNLTNSTVSDNTASADGGGIHNDGGIVNLTNSTVSGNTVIFNYGGGISSFGGTLNLTNSTVSSNTVGENGGGIYNIGSSTLNLTNSTVSGNTASTSGGGIYNGGGTTTLTNIILATNQAIGDDDCTNVLGSTLTSGGYNLVQAPNNCVFSATGDITSLDPLLGPLADNGGDTLTHALLPNSPAIDAGDDTACPSTDQRGMSRTVRPPCDIGAFEHPVAMIHLPIVLKNWPLLTKLLVFNDNTGGNAEVTIRGLSSDNIVASCTVPTDEMKCQVLNLKIWKSIEYRPKKETG